MLTEITYLRSTELLIHSKFIQTGRGKPDSSKYRIPSKHWKNFETGTRSKHTKGIKHNNSKNHQQKKQTITTINKQLIFNWTIQNAQIEV